ncbi:MAG: HD domain-containing protein [Chlorobi bacterium]|nr:HD domain-containing protein [Chlorobiota bacterium]
MKINLNENEFFKFFINLIDKIVNSVNIVLFKNNEEIYKLNQNIATYKKDFFIRNTPYKLTIYTNEPLDEQKVKKLGSFIDYAGFYIVNFTHNKQMVENYIELLKLSVEAMELQNPYYKNHSKIVSIVSEEVAKALYLPQNDIDNIVLAAQLHDIGMIGEVLNFLNKDKLSEDEIDLIKQHPLIGASLVEPINHVYPIAEIIKYHHERNDGKGYPLGLRGINIPLNANIVALGEFYAGLTSNRPYKKAISHQEAVKQIASLADKYFERSVVDAFLEVEKRINTKIQKVAHE